jgi:exopolysaccharide biosynthesis protein
VSAKFAELKPGDEVKLSTGTLPDLTGSQVGIGGGPALVRGGVALKFNGLQPRHPRTALGWNREHYFLVEVDGRQRVSAGMSFPELAAYMVKLGCTDAINLDGGGSATLWAFGNVMNSPSEGRERPAANGLVLVRKPAQD